MDNIKARVKKGDLLYFTNLRVAPDHLAQGGKICEGFNKPARTFTAAYEATCSLNNGDSAYEKFVILAFLTRYTTLRLAGVLDKVKGLYNAS